jgi:hypothetical protein
MGRFDAKVRGKHVNAKRPAGFPGVTKTICCIRKNLRYTKGAHLGGQNGRAGSNGLKCVKAVCPRGQNENPGLLLRRKRQWLPWLIRYSISMNAAV